MSTYCTRIYIKVNHQDLMDKLCAMDISDIGRGFYEAEDIFSKSSIVSDFFDGESSINERDLKALVGKVVEIIKGQGTILADTYSYDYDPFPQVCYYNGNEIISKLLAMDGEEFFDTVDIRDVSEWIRFVENADECDEYEYYEDEE